MSGITEFFIWVLFAMVAGELAWKVYHKKFEVKKTESEFTLTIKPKVSVAKEKELEGEKKNKD